MAFKYSKNNQQILLYLQSQGAVMAKDARKGIARSVAVSFFLLVLFQFLCKLPPNGEYTGEEHRLYHTTLLPTCFSTSHRSKNTANLLLLGNYLATAFSLRFRVKLYC